MTDDLQRAIDLTRKAAAAYGRADLVERIDVVGGRSDAVPLIVVAGEFKSGKSSLINAATATAACPAGAEHATTVPTLVFLGGPRGARAIPTDEGAPEIVDVDALTSLVTDASDAWERTERVEVRLGVISGPDEFALVDTPGAGGWTGRLGARAVSWLPLAMAALVTHDGASPLTASEMELIELSHRLCPSAAVAITRIDLHPAWREIVADTRARLDARGLGDVPIFAVSALLAGASDAEAIMRSGIDELFAWMFRTGAGRGSAARLRVSCLGVVQDLEADLGSQRDELAQVTPPETDDAQDEAPTLSLPWQTVLADGISDLGGELDARWKSAGRELVRASDEQLKDIDPARDWPTFETWMRQESTRYATEVFVQLQDGLAGLRSALAQALYSEADDLKAHSGAESAADVLASLDLDLRLQAVAGLGTRGFAALKASYSGMALAGMLAGVAGLSLAGPALIVFGVAMSGKSVRDDRKKQLEQRRQQGHAAARRYLDDVGALVQQSLRDGVRAGQRSLRDGCVLLAEGADERRERRDHSGLSEAERERRITDLNAELARLGKLRNRIERLVQTEAGVT